MLKTQGSTVMTSIGSASNNPPSSKPNGHFSTKVADRAQRKDAGALLDKMGSFHFDPDDDAATKKVLLNDIYTAIESGMAIPTTYQELGLLEQENELDEFETHREDLIAKYTLAGIPYGDEININVNEIKALLKKHQDKNGHYDTETLWSNYKERHNKTDQDGQEIIIERKEAVRGVFTENPQALFEKASEYPETMRRLIELLDLPAQNDKGWNLTSQAGKAGNPKLANAFEKAGFGPNLYPKAVVGFAKAMTEGASEQQSAGLHRHKRAKVDKIASNAQKSTALKELMGVTPLS